MRTYNEESGFVDWNRPPKKNWTCGEWLSYYDSLKKATGKAYAQQNWIKAWTGIGLNSEANSCSNDLGFYDVMEKRGIDTSSGDLDKMYAEAKDKLDAIMNIYKFIWFIVVGIVLIIVVALAWQIIKNPAQSISMGKMIASRGLLK